MDSINTFGGQIGYTRAARALASTSGPAGETPASAEPAASSVHASATLASHWGDLLDASPVSRMAVLEDAPPAPATGPAEGGSRRFIARTSDVPQAPPRDVERLKSLMGKVPTDRPGPADLGGGVRGQVDPDGEFTFTVPGRREGEAPREFSGNRQNFGDKLDVDAAKRLMDADLARGTRAGSGSLTLGSGGTVTFDEVVGEKGTRQYQARLDDGRAFQVNFDRQIGDPGARERALGNIAQVVSDAPAGVYSRVNADGTPDPGKGIDINIHPSIGVGASVTRDGQTRYGPVGAVTNPESPNRIDVGMPFTQNKELLGAVLDHEAGHLQDWRHNTMSEGAGTTFGRTQGANTYVSPYAQSGGEEDLAETHAEMLRFRQDFNHRTGQDFTALAPEDRRKALQAGWTMTNNGMSTRVEYSPEVVDKMMSVASLYAQP